MNSQEFVDIIKEVVVDDSIKSVQNTLQKPTGKSPAENLVALSKWYNNLNDGDKGMVLSVIREAVDTSVFGFLCVLDGVRSIENSNDKGCLKLYYEKKQEKILLNAIDEEFLHDML